MDLGLVPFGPLDVRSPFKSHAWAKISSEINLPYGLIAVRDVLTDDKDSQTIEKMVLFGEIEPQIP